MKIMSVGAFLQGIVQKGPTFWHESFFEIQGLRPNRVGGFTKLSGPYSAEQIARLKRVDQTWEVHPYDSGACINSCTPLVVETIALSEGPGQAPGWLLRKDGDLVWP